MRILQSVRFSYDPAKRNENLKKHNLDFEDAKQVIEGPETVTFEDKRFEYDEPRFITIGLLRGQIVVIVTTETEDHIRVISMRRATKNEQAIYYRYVR